MDRVHGTRSQSRAFGPRRDAITSARIAARFLLLAHGVPNVLIVDGDEQTVAQLAEEFRSAGWSVLVARAAAQAPRVARGHSLALIVGDLAPDDFAVTGRLCRDHPTAHVVVLAARASIDAAVESVQLGASGYLQKPARMRDVLRAVRLALARGGSLPIGTLSHVEDVYIQRVFEQCGRNVSSAARRLGIDRRTMQRKLAKSACALAGGAGATERSRSPRGSRLQRSA